MVTISSYPIYFISGFVKRNPKKVVFGCHLEKPAGNVYHFYKHCVAESNSGYELIWVATSSKSAKYLKEHGFKVVNKYTVSGVVACLTAGHYCYSCYISDISFALSRGASSINLWHGTPLKKIESDITTGIYGLRNKYSPIFKLIQPWLFFKPTKIMASSIYEIECFRTAFLLQEDIFYKTAPPRLLDLKQLDKKGGGWKILLAPTFRDGAALDFHELVDIETLNLFAAENNIEFYIKAHPSDLSLSSLDVSDFSNISVLDRLADIYELLKIIDLVVTDYSSIFFDCYYIGLPFLLHWPDVDSYNDTCREFYFDPYKVAFSLISKDTKELLDNISNWLNGDYPVLQGEFACFEKQDKYPLNIFN